MAYKKLIVNSVILYDDNNGKITPEKIKKLVETGFCQYEFGVGRSFVNSNRKIANTTAKKMVCDITEEEYYDGMLDFYLKENL